MDKPAEVREVVLVRRQVKHAVNTIEGNCQITYVRHISMNELSF